MIPFVKKIKQWETKTKESIEELEKLLLEIIEIYSNLQENIFDIHVQKIFKWWIPQAAEILALFQGCLSKNFTKSTEILFCKNSIKVLFLLTGEYLIFEPFFTFTSDNVSHGVDDDNNNQKNQIENLTSDEIVKNIQVKTQSHTEFVRKLLLTSFKYQNTKNRSDESISHFSDEQSNRNLSKQKTTSGLSLQDLIRTTSSTWSHTSTGDHSPRTESFYIEEPTSVSVKNKKRKKTRYIFANYFVIIIILGISSCYIY